MKNILITNASERVGVSFARDLRKAGDFHTIGIDSDPRKLQRVQTDEKILSPNWKSARLNRSLRSVFPLISRLIAKERLSRFNSAIEAELSVSKTRFGFCCR